MTGGTAPYRGEHDYMITHSGSIRDDIDPKKLEPAISCLGGNLEVEEIYIYRYI